MSTNIRWVCELGRGAYIVYLLQNGLAYCQSSGTTSLGGACHSMVCFPVHGPDDFATIAKIEGENLRYGWKSALRLARLVGKWTGCGRDSRFGIIRQSFQGRGICDLLQPQF